MDLIDPKTILIVQIGKIGDMILATPLFTELKRLFPKSILKVLAGEINKDIPLNHDSVDEVIIYKKNILKNLLLFNSSLRKIDIWIDTKDNYSKTSELLLKAFKPKLSLGFNIKAKIFDINLTDFQNGNHAVDINLSPVNYFEKPLSKRNVIPSFNIPDSVQNKVDLILDKSESQRILINISAGSESRYLAKEKWLNIINKINSSGLTSFNLIGLRKDIDIINYIVANSQGIDIKYIETHNILETADVVRRSDIVITPDTSIVHMCSVFDKPVIALFPDVKWNSEKFAPLSKYHEVVISKSENSIEDIEADEVFEKYTLLKEKLDSGNAESRTRVRKEDH